MNQGFIIQEKIDAPMVNILEHAGREFFNKNVSNLFRFLFKRQLAWFLDRVSSKSVTDIATRAYRRSVFILKNQDSR